MTSYYVFSALAAQREAEIERAVELQRRRCGVAQRAAQTEGVPRPRRLGWHRRRHLRLV